MARGHVVLQEPEIPVGVANDCRQADKAIRIASSRRAGWDTSISLLTAGTISMHAVANGNDAYGNGDRPRAALFALRPVY